MKKSANHLPQGWAKTTVGELVEFEYGKSLTKQVRESGAYVVFGSNGPVGRHSKALIQEPCLVVGRKGAIGRVHISEVPCWPIDTTYFVIPSSDLDLRFVFHLLTWHRLGELDRSTAIPGLNRDDAYAVPVELPPWSEQKRIVAKIEELFTQLDAGVEELRKAQAQLKRYRQAVLKAAVTGELTKEWREAHKDELEPASELLARILKERRAKWEADQLAKMEAAGKTPKNEDWKNKYTDPAAPVVDEMPAVPNQWAWARLDAIASLKGGITKDSKRHVTGRMVPYLRVANVQRGYLDLAIIKEIKATKDEIADLKLQANDVLFTEGGDRDKLGRGWIWNDELPLCIHQNHIFRGRLYLTELSAKMVSFFSNTFGLDYFLREGKQTTNLASINLTKLSALPVPIAPTSEQELIVSEIERTLSIVDALLETTVQSLAQAERMRQSILKQAFEGKLVPQDPNDEPAELLLERIKLERAKREAEKRAAPRSRRARPLRARHAKRSGQ